MFGNYQIREATTAACDVDALVRHRIRMFAELNMTVDEESDGQLFRRWFIDSLEAGTYRAWLAVTSDGQIVAGGGVTILAWPPGPAGAGLCLPFVYNVYTEPHHRRRGLARLIMGTIHEWCRGAGHRTIGLAASQFGEPLYTSMGYRRSPHPYMFLELESQPRLDPVATQSAFSSSLH